MAECVYCGSQNNLTLDHIPPRCMFSKPRPNNLIKVPSCETCNNAASKDDEYFRDTLILRFDASEHPDARKVLPGVFRSYKRQEAIGKKQDLLNSAVLMDANTPAGIYIGVVGGTTPQHERLERVVARIVRVLYWHRYGDKLSDDYEIECCVDSDLAEHDPGVLTSILSIYMPIIQQSPTDVIGEQIFEYWIQRWYDSDYVTACVLRFYGSVYYLCKAIPKTS